MTPVRICHTLEGLYLRIDMFNHNPSLRKLFVIRLLLCRQRMVLARFYRNATVRMVSCYPKVSQVSIKPYRITDRTADGVLIHLEVMLAAFSLLNIQYFQRVPFNDNLCL